MKKIMSVILVVVGSFLEVYYYAYRFTTDGIPWWLGITIGIALNCFLMLLVWNERKWWAGFLIAFSVLSTSAGQTFSLIQQGKTEALKQYAPGIAELKAENITLAKERDALEAQILGTVTTLEDRYDWKNTLSKAEKEKKDKQEKIEKNRALISEYENRINTGKESGGIYSFYSELLFGRVTADFLKFMLHTALSIFIAFMAPTGIKSLINPDLKKEVIPKIEPEPEPEPKEEPETETLKKIDLDSWIRFMWLGYTKSGKIPSENVLKAYSEISGTAFDLELHREYLGNAIRAKLISPDGNLLKTEKEAKTYLKIGF